MEVKNIFENLSAYLDPRNHPAVPLIGVPLELLPVFAQKERIRVYAQAAYRWPLGNLKHPSVFNMLIGAKSRGKLEGIHTVVESSSGNTAFCLARLARYFGIKRTILFIPSDIARTKEEKLRNLGSNVELVKCYNRPDELSAIERAAECGREPGHFYLGQYQNPDNVVGHARYHVVPAWEQLGGRMTIYAGGLGTCGHVRAAFEFAQRQERLLVVAAHCAAKNPIPGIRTLAQLQPVKLSASLLGVQRPELLIVEVFQQEAYRSSSNLALAGINAGPTSGAAFVALVKCLSAAERNGDLDGLRNEDGDIVCVFMCGDSKDLYDEEKYRTILDPDQIPVENEKLPLVDYVI